MSCWNNSSKVSKYKIPLLTNSDRSCDVVPNEIGVKKPHLTTGIFIITNFLVTVLN